MLEDEALDELEALLLLEEDELLDGGGGGGAEELLEDEESDELLLLVEPEELLELSVDDEELDAVEELLEELAGAGRAFCVTGTWPHAATAIAAATARIILCIGPRVCGQLLEGGGAGGAGGSGCAPSCQIVPIEGKRRVAKRATAG